MERAGPAFAFRCGTEIGPKFVPRLAVLGEWDGLGEVCWKWIVLLGLNLPIFMGFYALLQRTEIFVYWAVIAMSGWVGFLRSPTSQVLMWGTRRTCRLS